MVGVPLARVGLVVVDADRHPVASDGVAALRAIELPPHPIITTRSGGEHHFFRQPNSQLRFARWAGGEILGVGRFVVGYDLAPFVSEAPQWPEWLMAKLPHSHMGTTGGANAGSNSGNGFAVSAVPMSESLERPPTDYELNYANASLKNDCGELWSCKPGDRNRKLNAIAYAMGRQIARGWIKRERVEKMLLLAAEHCKLVKDDGLQQCKDTIASGIKAGMARPYHDVRAEWD
jgi:hypothetical protein